MSVYDRVEPVYDRRHARFLSWSGAAAQSALEGALMALIQPTNQVLDAGCGTGRMAERLLNAEPSARIVLLDSSPRMLRAAQHVPVRRVHGDMHALPFEDGTFDFCFSAWSLEPLRAPDVALAELLRVTRPDGAVLLAFCSSTGGGLSDRAVQAAMSARGLGRPLASGKIVQLLRQQGVCSIRRLPAPGRTFALMAKKGSRV